MLTDMIRDQLFTIGWFGLMAMVWFGWGQEAPPKQWRWWLAVGSIAGVVVAGIFGYLTFANWGLGGALDQPDRRVWFGWLTGIELLAAGLGCVTLWRRGQSRWMAWWVAVVVATHFVVLAWILDDWSLAVLTAVQLIALVALLPRLRASDAPTSRLVGPVMGASLLAFALASIVVFATRTMGT